MNHIKPIVATVIIDNKATTIPALNVSELFIALEAYAKESEFEWVKWMESLPSQEEVQAKVNALEGTFVSEVISNHRIGNWDEYLNIELMPYWWVNRLISPFIDQVRKLATEWNNVIGHPENPFPENVINDLVKESFELIKEQRPSLPDWE